MTIQETSDRLIEEYKYLEAHEVAHYNKCKFCKPDDYCSKAIYNRHKTKEVGKILEGRLQAFEEELYWFTHLFQNKECPDGDVVALGIMISAVSPFAKLVNTHIDLLKSEIKKIDELVAMFDLNRSFHSPLSTGDDGFQSKASISLDNPICKPETLEDKGTEAQADGVNPKVTTSVPDTLSIYHIRSYEKGKKETLERVKEKIQRLPKCYCNAGEECRHLRELLRILEDKR
jgi:hypothetical protein